MAEASARFRGHSAIVQQFRECYARGRLGNAYLFVGPPGVGKRTFALRLAQGLLCDRAESPVEPCQTCSPCQQVLADSHPDIAIIRRPAERAFIPLEHLIGDREHRSSEGFCHWVALTPQSGRRKIGIIDDADYLNLEGANSLLKTLEEPPPKSILILIATSEQRQLPTIRSRCQIIRFGGLATNDLTEMLLEQGECTDRAVAQRAASVAAGSLETARHACDPEWSSSQTQIWQGLAGLPGSRLDLVQTVQQMVDAAGADSSEKRRAMRLVLDWSVQFWRAQMRCSQDAAPADTPPVLLAAVAKLPLPAEATEMAASRLERTLDALVQVDSNVMLPAFVDAWVDDLCEQVSWI